jgi:hypothetical protein
MVDEGPPAELGAIRRQVKVVVNPSDAGNAARLLNRWPTERQADGARHELLVHHDSGRDVNAALVAGGIIAESVVVEQPRLEDRFLELTKPTASANEENHHDLAAAG